MLLDFTICTAAWNIGSLQKISYIWPQKSTGSYWLNEKTERTIDLNTGLILQWNSSASGVAHLQILDAWDENQTKSKHREMKNIALKSHVVFCVWKQLK